MIAIKKHDREINFGISKGKKYVKNIKHKDMSKRRGYKNKRRRMLEMGKIDGGGSETYAERNSSNKGKKKDKQPKEFFRKGKHIITV